MKKALIAVYALMIIIFSMYVNAALSCSITDVGACTGAVVLELSGLSDGGSHAGFPADSAFTKAVCCSGVPGLEVTSSEEGQVMGCLSNTADGHMNKTGSKSAYTPIGGTCLNLTASTTGLTCEYAPASCLSPFTCLFSISADDDAHVSGCKTTPNEYPFTKKYCCKLEGGCAINNIYWGVFDEEGNIEPLVGEGPVGTEEGIMVFLIAETSGCRGASAEFDIYWKKGIGTYLLFNQSTSLHGKPILMGNFKLGKTADDGEALCFEDADGREICFEDMVLATWTSPGAGDGGGPDGFYNFTVKLTKPAPGAYTVESDFSQKVKVDDNCQAELNETWFTESCGLDFPTGCVCPWKEGLSYKYSTKCPDTDCDGIPDCIDDFLATVADTDLVDRCSGTAYGRAGCIPAMDCTNLEWSECKNCEAGTTECDAVKDATSNEIKEGDQYMERCGGMDEIEATVVGQWDVAGGCNCNWNGGTAPPGCTDAVLNQWNNRFKACIEEEEFPVFTGFNVIAVLVILSMYYAIIVIRKNRE